MARANLTEQDSEEFQNMKMVRFKWGLLQCNPENSFKKALKVHAVSGIVIGIIILLLAGASFFIGATMSHQPAVDLRGVFHFIGGVFIFSGVLLLVFSSLLLHRVLPKPWMLVYIR